MHRRSDTLAEDAMMAATARVHGLTVATRNERDFAHFNVAVLNPFKLRAPEASWRSSLPMVKSVAVRRLEPLTFLLAKHLVSLTRKIKEIPAPQISRSCPEIA